MIGEDLPVKNATIREASLSIEDHGLLTGWVSLDYGDDGVQGFGGIALYLPKGFTHHSRMSIAGHFIFRVLEVADVKEWSRLKGRTVRVRSDFNKVYAIGHITKNIWYTPSEEGPDA